MRHSNEGAIMSATFFKRLTWMPCALTGLLGAGLCLTLAGCGNSGDPSAEATSTVDADSPQKGAANSSESSLPTVAIANSAISRASSIADDNEAIEIADLKVGSAEWLLREITRLRVQAYPDEKDADSLKEIRRKRNLKLIELATEVIGQTHEIPDQERLFRLGVHHLMEARLELALGGDSEHIDQLYADAASLHQRNPNSKAAEEAAYVLVKFAQSNAARFAKKEPRWLEEFARQARLYVQNFPQDQLRGPNALFAAAESCELHGRIDDARACFTQLQQQFPDHLLAAQATGILRRIDIEGRPMSLGGPTLDGGYWSLDDARGKAVLIAFWSSHARGSANDTKQLNELHRQYGERGLEIVGINLDLEESDVQDFIAAQNIDWPQIFFVDDEQRGWDHPVANYYGIRQVPAYWLVDAEGTVRDTKASLDTIAETLPDLIGTASADAAPSPAEQ